MREKGGGSAYMLGSQRKGVGVRGKNREVELLKMKRWKGKESILNLFCLQETSFCCQMETGRGSLMQFDPDPIKSKN